MQRADLSSNYVLNCNRQAISSRRHSGIELMVRLILRGIASPFERNLTLKRLDDPSRRLTDATENLESRRRVPVIARRTRLLVRQVDQNPCQCRCVCCFGKFNSMAKAYLVTDNPRNHDCFQVFELHKRRWRWAYIQLD